ncbi:unnamed protein product, partial [Discosporangium mesarthrocarpum]
RDREDAGLRLDWTKLLFRAGYRLRYPQGTTAAAIVLFHRFLIRERVAKHQQRRDLILTTCLFLAGKVTEAPRRLRDVINVLHMLTCKNKDEPPPLDQVGYGTVGTFLARYAGTSIVESAKKGAYWTMKEKIVEFEQVLLRTIKFHVETPDPYRLLLNYAHSLRCPPPVVHTAWGLISDSLFCPRTLTTPPPALACAAIYLASRVHGDFLRLEAFSVPPCASSNGGVRDKGADSPGVVSEGGPGLLAQ